MPRGLKKIEQIAADNKARQDAYVSGEGFNRALMLKNGETATGRFLEEGDGIWYLYSHPLPKKPGQQYNDQTLCLDQPFTESEEASYVEGSKRCYACELEGVGRPTRVVINFIRYDEPKLVRDAKGGAVKDAAGNYQYDGVEPTLVVCNFATGVGGRFAYLESQKGIGMTNHVVTIHKTGDKNNPYMIDVVETKPPEPFEVALFEKKVSPPEAIRSMSPKYKSLPLMSYGDMQRAYSGAAAASGFAQRTTPGQAQGGDQAGDNVYAQAAQAAASGHVNPGAFGS